MISKCKKVTIKCVIAALSLSLLAGCSSISSPNPTNNGKNQTASNTSSQTNTNTNTNANINANNTNSSASSSSTTTNGSSVEYKNTQYGFNFTLPKDWNDFSIITEIWEGNNVTLGKVTETGPMISIRHPQWTSKNPRQDIPIMVFTLAQWNLIQQGKISIGAAPIGPSELARNNIYVFALPARYNFAFMTGYKEVEEILNSHPLKSTKIVQSTDSNKDILLKNQ